MDEPVEREVYDVEVRPGTVTQMRLTDADAKRIYGDRAKKTSESSVTEVDDRISPTEAKNKARSTAKTS